MQIVEDHERAELQARVHRAARGATDHRGRAQVVQGPDVGAVGHLMRQPHVTGAVARDVEDVDAREAPARDLDRPERRLVQEELGIGEAGQRVGPGSGDDADRHGARSYLTPGVSAGWGVQTAMRARSIERRWELSWSWRCAMPELSRWRRWDSSCDSMSAAGSGRLMR